MVEALAQSLAKATDITLSTITIKYNQNASGWTEQAIKDALTNAGIDQAASPQVVSYDGPKLAPTPPPVTTTTPSGTIGSSTGGGAGVWYPGQPTAPGQPTYTQIVDETATTEMLQQGSVVNVVGQSPTGIIVKFTPTALSGHSTVTINNSIGNVTLTATQIANLVQQADGGVIYITINQTADGVSVSATAGGQVVTL